MISSRTNKIWLVPPGATSKEFVKSETVKLQFKHSTLNALSNSRLKNNRKITITKKGGGWGVLEGI